jgi:inosine-uridine nucleoside N-ribohydrolase
MAAAIDPSCILLQSPFYVTVELSGKNTRGQMIVDRRGHLMRPPNVFLIEGINVALLKTMMVWSLGDESVLYNPPL